MASENWLFKLRGPVTRQQGLIFGALGFLLLLVIWYILTAGVDPMVKSGVLPKPFSSCDSLELTRTFDDEFGKEVNQQVMVYNTSVVCGFKDMYQDGSLFKNFCLSLSFNLGGYYIALLFSIPIAFLIALFPVFRASFESQINAVRFIPLTAITGIFIIAAGIGGNMKIYFLAFGIMIYLIPVIMQRIYEVKDVYLKTVYTIGANDWQTVKTVYLPSVLSRLSDDLRVLTAISWTYIIVAEAMGNQGGLGSLIYNSGQRMGRPDKTYAVLLIFILIGIVQDRLFIYLDKKFFPHKYQTKNKYSGNLKEASLMQTVTDFAINIFGWIFLAVYILLIFNQYFGLFREFQVLEYLFKDTIWVMHVTFLILVGFKIYGLFKKKNAVLS